MPTPADIVPPQAYDQPQTDQSQPQIKVCSACQRPLSTDPANTPFILQDGQTSSDTSIVCGPCWSHLVAIRTEPQLPQPNDSLFTEVEREIRRRVDLLRDGGNEANEPRQPPRIRLTHPTEQPCPDAEMDTGPSGLLPLLPVASGSPAIWCHTVPSVDDLARDPVNTAPTQAPLAILTHDLSPRSPRTHTTPQRDTVTISSSTPRSKPPLRHFTASPLTDITHLRVRSQGHHCLYPGASFQGTQKSGRNSYDVTVTIVDVDFSRSHLCGYLRIRGLTEDWPELTTYFDAEIIGSRYGFLTRQWGASEQEDWVHWARFPAFRHVKNELEKPHLTMKDADRGAVFMRWKEKFLVPDHRVQDINGASFAGFYYVCVDFNPQPGGSQTSQPSSLPPSLEDDTYMPLPSTSPTVSKPEFSPRARRESMNRGARRMGRSSSRGAPSRAATMSGFYFHQNSEPYQQLSLVHVPEHTTSCFEFR